MQRIPVSELRARLVAEDAAWCEALAARFRDRQPSFTQAALDARAGDVLARTDLSELMELGEDAL